MNNWLYISNENNPSIYEKLYAGSTIIGQNSILNSQVGGTIKIYLDYEYDGTNNRYECSFMINVTPGMEGGLNNPGQVEIKLNDSVLYTNSIAITRNTIYTDTFYLDCDLLGNLPLNNIKTKITLTDNSGNSSTENSDRNIRGEISEGIQSFDVTDPYSSGPLRYFGEYCVIANPLDNTFTIKMDLSIQNSNSVPIYTDILISLYNNSISKDYDSNNKYLVNASLPSGRIKRNETIHLGIFTETWNFQNNGTTIQTGNDLTGGDLILDASFTLVELGVLKAQDIKIKQNNIWKQAAAWFKQNGAWKRCIIWKKINGVWKKGR